jgi:hypothetical protein
LQAVHPPADQMGIARSLTHDSPVIQPLEVVCRGIGIPIIDATLSRAGVAVTF